MKRLALALFCLAAVMPPCADAAALTKSQAAFFANRRIAVSRDTATIPGAVITTWYRDGKPDTKAPAVVTNYLHAIVGEEQKNHLQERLAELRTAYASATNSLFTAQARAARLDALRAYLVEQRDKVTLQTTKAIYQALIDRIDGNKN